MNLMSISGAVCWVIELIVLALFLYFGRDRTDLKSYILKGATSSMVIFYGMDLILIYTLHEGHPISQASILFMAGLFFAFLGDMGLATMQLKHGGSSKKLFEMMSTEQVTLGNLTFGVVGVLFIISFFLELVAFVKGIHGDTQEFAIPFLLMFLLPLLFTLVGALLTQFEMPELSTKMFIIAVFFLLLTSALFASVSVYSFWMYQQDPSHASFVLTAGILFALSVMMIAIRYSRPDKFETRPIRALSLFLNYISRMMLAGCAFLF